MSTKKFDFPENTFGINKIFKSIDDLDIIEKLLFLWRTFYCL